MSLPELLANTEGPLTTLEKELKTGETTLKATVAAPSALQASGQFRVVIGKEILLVTAGASGKAWTVARAQEGTSEENHPNGSEISHELTAAGALLVAGLVNVRAFGAKGDGTTDDTTAFEAARAVWVTAKTGVLYIPAGEYKVSSANLLTMNFPGQSIAGAGAGSTIIKPTSAVKGDVIRWQMEPWTEMTACGKISGLCINGENAGTNACGIHLGDGMGYGLEDVVVEFFNKTGSVGIKVENATHWTEQMLWRNVFAQLNTVGVEFLMSGAGTNSWAYCDISLRLYSTTGQKGLVFKNSGHLYGCRLRVAGDLDETAVGIELAETSLISGQMAIALESFHTGVKPIKIATGAVLEGAGYIDTSFGNVEGQSERVGSYNMPFAGWFNVPGICHRERAHLVRQGSHPAAGGNPRMGRRLHPGRHGCPELDSRKGVDLHPQGRTLRDRKEDDLCQHDRLDDLGGDRMRLPHRLPLLLGPQENEGPIWSRPGKLPVYASTRPSTRVATRTLATAVATRSVTTTASHPAGTSVSTPKARIVSTRVLAAQVTTRQTESTVSTYGS